MEMAASQEKEEKSPMVPVYRAKYCPRGYVRNEIGKWEGMLARPEYFSLSAEEKAAICNGIGADSGLTVHFPDTIWGLDCKEAGDRHDYDYEIGGTEEDRAIADAVFLHNCRTLIRKGSWWLRWPRERRAVSYYLALRVGGKKYYNFTTK